MAVEEVTELLEAGGLQAVGLVDDLQLAVRGSGLVADPFLCGAVEILDGVADGGRDAADLVFELAGAGDHGWGPERGAGSLEHPGWRVVLSVEAVREPWFEFFQSA
ncbi:MAG: hypothetical protein ACLP22_05600 [Solirubrobacteraceae bacterium]